MGQMVARRAHAWLVLSCPEGTLRPSLRGGRSRDSIAVGGDTKGRGAVRSPSPHSPQKVGDPIGPESPLAPNQRRVAA